MGSENLLLRWLWTRAEQIRNRGHTNICIWQELDPTWRELLCKKMASNRIQIGRGTFPICPFKLVEWMCDTYWIPAVEPPVRDFINYLNLSFTQCWDGKAWMSCNHLYWKSLFILIIVNENASAPVSVLTNLQQLLSGLSLFIIYFPFIIRQW